MIEEPINIDKYSKKTKQDLKKTELNFYIDRWEELVLQDLAFDNSDLQIKLNKNLTKDFHDWIKDKIKNKENISISIKGMTRSGKSLLGLKIADVITRRYTYGFNTERIVCGNQKEYRQKLQKASFGMVFQIDENAFSNAGIGANLETEQLKDIQNIIAKMNIHTIYITPRIFLNNNSEVGLAYWGKDTKNWVSRFLLYSLRGHNPILLGYILVDVGSIFSDYGCVIYRLLGGCNNPNKIKVTDIPKYLLNDNICIPEQYRKEPLKAIELLNKDDKEKHICPFYRVCEHPICKYEHKKDSWISKEMKGGLDERTEERYKIAVNLMLKLGIFREDEQMIKLKAKSGKDFRVKAKLHIPKITNTKLTITEMEEVFDICRSITELETFFSILEQINFNINDLNKMEGGEVLIDYYNHYLNEKEQETNETAENS